MGSIHAVFLLVLMIAAQIAPLFSREQSGHPHHHHEHHQTLPSKRKRKQKQ